MRFRRHILVAAAIIGVMVTVWFGSEFLYLRSISPTGVVSVADHFHRLGEPLRIVQFQRDGATYFELIGVAHSGFHPLAAPSAPPSYIYDEFGRLVEWCSDPGDQPAFRMRWPQTNTQPIDIATFRKKYEH